MRLFPNSGTEPAPTCACAIKAKSSAKKCSWSRSVLECGGSAPLSAWRSLGEQPTPSAKSAAAADARQNLAEFLRPGAQDWPRIPRSVLECGGPAPLLAEGLMQLSILDALSSFPDPHPAAPTPHLLSRTSVFSLFETFLQS